MKTLTKAPLLIGALFALAPFAKADDIAQLKADVAALQNIVGNQQTTINQLSGTAAMLVKKTQYITIGGKTMFIKGCNVQITNDVNPGVGPNGLGNLIIGWNPARSDNTDVRSGSHFLVMGAYNNFSGNTGIVYGTWNEAGQNAVVLNGYKNVGKGNGSVTLTGSSNLNEGMYGIVGGGSSNYVSKLSFSSFILSGKSNQAWGNYGGVLTGTNGGVDTSVGYALVDTGNKNQIFGGDFSEILTGDQCQIFGWNKHNVIGTGYKNELHKSCEGVFLADGTNFYVDYDGRTAGVTKDWVNRLMSEGYLFDKNH